MYIQIKMITTLKHFLTQLNFIGNNGGIGGKKIYLSIRWITVCLYQGELLLL